MGAQGSPAAILALPVGVIGKQNSCAKDLIQLLDVRGTVRRTTDDGVLRTARGTDVADDDFARINSDADLHFRLAGSGEFRVEGSKRGFHSQRSLHSLLSVVAGVGGGPECRQEPVAQKLVDEAAVRVNRLRHYFEKAVQALDHLTRRARLAKAREVADVAKQDRDFPALTLGLDLAFEDGPRNGRTEV